MSLVSSGSTVSVGIGIVTFGVLGTTAVSVGITIGVVWSAGMFWQETAVITNSNAKIFRMSNTWVIKTDFIMGTFSLLTCSLGNMVVVAMSTDYCQTH